MDDQCIKVLLIEDNPGDARLIQELLRADSMAQFDLLRVERLAIGLQQLDEETVDVLLLDLGLPDSHGLGTFATLQSQAPDVPILVLTGLDDQALALQAVRQGAQDYLVKGRVDSNLLTRAIRYAIERKRSEEALRRRNRELALLNRVIAASTSTLDVEHLLQIACQELAQAFDLPQAAAALLDAEAAEAVVVAEHLVDGNATVLGKTIDLAGNPAVTCVLERKRALVIADAQAEERLTSVHKLLRDWGAVSLLIVPIILPRERVAGVLGLCATEQRGFNGEEIALAQSVAAAAGQSLETSRLYQALRSHAERLEETVAQRTAELEVALELARDADRFKSEFVSNVSHELRTPLTAIKLYLSLLTRGRPEKRRAYLDTLHRETSRLQNLIEGLLDLSRLDLGKTHANLEATDLNLLVSTLAADREELVADRGLQLDVDLVEDLPPALADPKLFEQVLTNLLTNAINYTSGGGEIGLRTDVVELDGQQWVTVSVADTGPGISQEEQTRLFERFYRGEAGWSSDVPGTGLGLAICKEIVARHGGQITLESQLGYGSTFTVWLTVAPSL